MAMLNNQMVYIYIFYLLQDDNDTYIISDFALHSPAEHHAVSSLVSKWMQSQFLHHDTDPAPIIFMLKSQPFLFKSPFFSWWNHDIFPGEIHVVLLMTPPCLRVTAPHRMRYIWGIVSGYESHEISQQLCMYIYIYTYYIIYYRLYIIHLNMYIYNSLSLYMCLL